MGKAHRGGSHEDLYYALAGCAVFFLLCFAFAMWYSSRPNYVPPGSKKKGKKQS